LWRAVSEGYLQGKDLQNKFFFQVLVFRFGVRRNLGACRAEEHTVACISAALAQKQVPHPAFGRVRNDILEGWLVGTTKVVPFHVSFPSFLE
jgi:hypothetical protein